MALEHWNQAGFEQAIASGQLMAVDFWADWCGPCRMLAPAIEHLAEKYEGRARVGKINTDENPSLAVGLGITGIPTVIFYKDGKELERVVGVAPGQNPVEVFSNILDRNL